MDRIEDSYIKCMETEPEEISKLARVSIHCSLRMFECRDESEILDYDSIF